MNDINGKEINHPAFLKLNTGDTVFTVKGKNGLSFYGEKLGKIEVLNEENIEKHGISILDRIKIAANEEIFYEFQSVAKAISSLGGIVQNDIDINREVVDEWETILDEAVDHLKKLKIDTKNYITKEA